MLYCFYCSKEAGNFKFELNDEMHNSSSLQFIVRLKRMCLLCFFHNCKPDFLNFRLAVEYLNLLLATNDPSACWDKILAVSRGEMDKVFINLFLSLRCSLLWNEAYLILGKSSFLGVNTQHFSAKNIFTFLSKCHHPAGVTWKSKDRRKEHHVATCIRFHFFQLARNTPFIR